MRLFTWLGGSPLWLGKEAGGQVGSQPLSVFEAPVGVRGDRKALHLKLPQIGRGGRQAGGGPTGPDKGEPPTCLYLPETTLPELGATVNWSYWNFSVWAGMEWGWLTLALRELRWLSRRGTAQGSEAGAGVLPGKGAQRRQRRAVMLTGKTVTVVAGTGTGRDKSRQHRVRQGRKQESDLTQQGPRRQRVRLPPLLPSLISRFWGILSLI